MSKVIINGPEMNDHEVQCRPDATTIGRLGTNALVLPAANVSREHVKIIAEGKDSFLFDLGSENGTALNDVIIRANEKYLLQHNDVITIGPYRLKFSRLDEKLEQSFNDITDSDILEVKLLKKVLTALDKETTPSIEVLNGASEGKKLLLTEDLQTVVVGRDPTVEFAIEEYVVSRRHAKLELRTEGWTLLDLESKNGTYVNNSRITEVVLHDGDRIAFGTIVCIFRNPRDVNLAAVSEHVKEVRLAQSAALRQAQGAAQRLKEITKKREEAEQADEEEKEETGSEATAPPHGGAAELPSEEELKEREIAHEYPVPQPATARIRFSPFEIGLLWMGTVVFLVTVVLLVKLLS